MAKLSPDGAHLWSTYLGGLAEDVGFAIAVDAAGNVLVTGETYSPDWTSSGFDTSYNGVRDAFVAKIYGNRAPVLDPIGDKAVDEGQTLSFTITASDPNDIPPNQLTLSASGLPAGASFDPATGVFSWTPTEAQGSEVYKFKVQVSDGVVTTEQTVELTVSEVNVAPVLASIGDKSVDEQALLTFTASATDQDDPVQTLRFSLDQASRDKATQIDQITGVFTWTPTVTDAGFYPVTITVTDNATNSANLIDSETITIGVGEVWSLRAKKSGGYNLLLRRNGADIELVNRAKPKQQFFKVQDGTVPKITISALEKAADKLTVDYRFGPFSVPEQWQWAFGVVFDGGGGKGTDTLTIKGTTGPDSLQGGSGQEILIGGTTSYDTNAAALAALMQEWASGPDDSFVDRCTRLESGIPFGKKRISLKANSTVLNDKTADTLFGGLGYDWFFGFAKDDVRDRGPDDR